MCFSPRFKMLSGFTLLEILLCLLLLSMVTFFSLPYTPLLYKKNQSQTISADIKNAIHTAKMQALLQGQALALTSLNRTNNWSDGMRLVIDNPSHHYQEDSDTLYEWHWTSTGTQVEWHGFQSNEYVLFATDLRSSRTNGYFLIKNADQQIKLVLNRLGRVRDSEAD